MRLGRQLGRGAEGAAVPRTDGVRLRAALPLHRRCAHRQPPFTRTTGPSPLPQSLCTLRPSDDPSRFIIIACLYQGIHRMISPCTKPPEPRSRGALQRAVPLNPVPCRCPQPAQPPRCGTAVTARCHAAPRHPRVRGRSAESRCPGRAGAERRERSGGGAPPHTPPVPPVSSRDRGGYKGGGAAGAAAVGRCR